jgi:hypothetical protein
MPARAATDEQVLAASAALVPTVAFPARDWPPDDSTGLDQSGLYAWFLDRAGARELTIGYGLTVRAALAYVGEAGVDTEANLCERVECHLWKCAVARSTLRRSLACGLLGQHGWKVAAHRKLAIGCEGELTAWMRAHLRVAVHPFQDRVVLEHLEELVIHHLRPQLNLPRSKRKDTPLQKRIRELRKEHDLQ